MEKSYIITFSISVLVITSIAVIALMLMLPQQVQILEGNINKYDTIKKSEYTFESTKDITNESLLKQYSITNEEISAFKSQKQYQPGNSDPFAPITDNKDTNSQSDKNNSDSGSTDGSTSGSQNAKDKTTNSNGGIENPPSTSK